VLTTYAAGPFWPAAHSVLKRSALLGAVAPGDTTRVMTSLQNGLVDTLLRHRHVRYLPRHRH